MLYLLYNNSDNINVWHVFDWYTLTHQSICVHLYLFFLSNDSWTGRNWSINVFKNKRPRNWGLLLSNLWVFEGAEWDENNDCFFFKAFAYLYIAWSFNSFYRKNVFAIHPRKFAIFCLYEGELTYLIWLENDPPKRTTFSNILGTTAEPVIATSTNGHQCY